MLISKALEDDINAQVGREFGASLQYVSIASYFDNENLEQIAAMGGGRYYQVRRVEDIPRIFLQETVIVAGRDIIEGQFTPAVALQSPAVRGLTSLPPLYGYNGILHARIAPTMEAFRKFLDTSEACELFVLHDDSARWAVYAGDSVTALGAEEALRDAINGALRAEGNKGLRKMTLQAFPGWEVCDVWETFTTSEGSCDWILRPPPPSVPVRIS